MKFTVTFAIYIVIFLSFYVVAAPSSEESYEDDLDEGRSIQSRVIDGKPTQAYPHIVSLQRGNKHYCAGSIISPMWILTADFCRSGSVEAVAGTKNLKSKNRRIQRRMVVLFIGHEDYDNTVQESANDIAVAKVDKPFNFDDKLVSSIDLPMPFAYPEGFAFVAGWGKFSKRNNNESPVLRHLQIPVHSPSSCSILWANSNYTDTNCCAGFMNGNGAACTSDAGGPLMTEVSKRPLKHVIVGIVSWARAECGQAGKPGVYTLVSNYIDWIKGKIEENP